MITNVDYEFDFKRLPISMRTNTIPKIDTVALLAQRSRPRFARLSNAQRIRDRGNPLLNRESAARDFEFANFPSIGEGGKKYRRFPPYVCRRRTYNSSRHCCGNVKGTRRRGPTVGRTCVFTTLRSAESRELRDPVAVDVHKSVSRFLIPNMFGKTFAHCV